MKNNPAFPILICLLLALAHSIAAPSGDTKLDSAIQKANSEFLTAVKTGDAVTIAAPYADNAVFVLPDGTCIQGRAGIEKMYRTRFEQSGPPNSTKLDSKNVMLDGDVAYESGNAEVTVMKEDKPVTRTSRYLTIWQRAADGEWKIVRNIVLSS
jgi:uncharacterized protein (TIGR02246 family)